MNNQGYSAGEFDGFGTTDPDQQLYELVGELIDEHGLERLLGKIIAVGDSWHRNPAHHADPRLMKELGTLDTLLRRAKDSAFICDQRAKSIEQMAEVAAYRRAYGCCPHHGHQISNGMFDSTCPECEAAMDYE